MNDNANFAAAAELYPSPGASGRHVTYMRFDTLADAVLFAIEELNPMLLNGAVLESDEVRYDAGEIEALYRSQTFPLRRK